MKKIYILTAASFLTFAANAQTVSTADFENLTYAEGLDYETGENLEGKFKSGEFYFINNSSMMDYGGYSYFNMDGFCYSKRTEKTYSADSYSTDQFNNQIGTGAEDSEGFAVSFSMGASTITADYTFKPQSCFITNNAYVLSSIMNGDAYARRFNYDDKFVLTIKGYKDELETASIDVELASKGSIIFQWVPVDLSALGEVDKVDFSLSSTDTGDYGMNTPAYFCLDNFTAELTDTPTSITKAATRSSEDKQLYDLLGRKVNAPVPGTLYIK